MTRPPRRCLGVDGRRCDELIHRGSRCRKCHTEQRQIYSGTWTRRSREARARARRCSRCGSTDNLELDHVAPRSLAGVTGRCRRRERLAGLADGARIAAGMPRTASRTRRSRDADKSSPL